MFDACKLSWHHVMNTFIKQLNVPQIRNICFTLHLFLSCSKYHSLLQQWCQQSDVWYRRCQAVEDFEKRQMNNTKHFFFTTFEWFPWWYCLMANYYIDDSTMRHSLAYWSKLGQSHNWNIICLKTDSARRTWSEGQPLWCAFREGIQLFETSMILTSIRSTLSLTDFSSTE